MPHCTVLHCTKLYCAKLYCTKLYCTVLFYRTGTIMYWSAGLSPDYHGSRFLTFEVMLITFSMCCAQLFRLFACITPNIATAFPMAGVCMILMVLFSGKYLHLVTPRNHYIEAELSISYRSEVNSQNSLSCLSQSFSILLPLSYSALRAVSISNSQSSCTDFSYCP